MSPGSPTVSADNLQVTEPPNTFAAGDTVELVRDIPGRKELKAGARALVVVGNDQDDRQIWNLCTIVLGDDPEQSKAWCVRPAHL
jgi:hypothetical protein